MVWFVEGRDPAQNDFHEKVGSQIFWVREPPLLPVGRRGRDPAQNDFHEIVGSQIFGVDRQTDGRTIHSYNVPGLVKFKKNQKI